MPRLENDWYVDGSEGLVDKFLNCSTGHNLIERIAYVISKRPGRAPLLKENWEEAEHLAKLGLLRQIARKSGRL
jgi:hypothetical protein